MQKPNLFRRSIMFLVDAWRLIMDVKYNPLTFGLIAIYYIGWLGYDIVTSIIVHAAILIPMMITNAVFVDAERDGHKWLAEWNEEKSKYKIFVNRLKRKNLVRWDMDNEA